MKTTTTSYGRFIFLIGLLFNLSQAQAQQIALPDSNWGNWLYLNGFSSCLTRNATGGWQLDVSCNAVQQADVISCNSSRIRDLSGISYFSSLRTLVCFQNELYSLPVLPASLTELDCATNHLSNLPALPAGLSVMGCGDNQLSALPALPTSLDRLYCRGNQLSSLPTLPVSLQLLDCGNNQLSSLPSLPSALVTLDCSINQLSSLPNLPPSLKSLYCNDNSISNLPTLPTGLADLVCYKNRLTSLPMLPLSLGYLDCYHNQLTSLPALPPNLTNFSVAMNQLISMPGLPPLVSSFSCSYNLLTSIPSLPPHLKIFSCSNNQLSYLPALPPALTSIDCSNNALLKCLPQIYPGSLNQFYIAGTQIGCIPNRFTAFSFDIDPTSLPICDAASGCSFYNGIEDDEAEIGAVLLYPNPNNGSFTLETSNLSGADYQVYDMMGSLIAHGAVSSDHQAIYLADAAAGVYTLVVKGGTDSKAIRFVVNN